MKKKRLIIRDKSGNVIEKDMEDGYDSPEMYQRMDSTSEMQVTAIQPATVVSNNVPGKLKQNNLKVLFFVKNVVSKSSICWLKF